MVPKRTIQIALPSTGEEEWLALKAPLESGWLTQGPKVAAFERAFAVAHEVKYALACTSATTGLHLALAALAIGPGDEVIVPSFTWVATANVAVYCGAQPVFADIDPATFNIDVADVKRKLTTRTRAVIPVHLFGLCADIEALRMALPAGVHIIEDAACAAGARYRGRPAGGIGTLGVFSFHPRKSITTGEGGMVTTNDGALAERVNQLRNHGASISDEMRHHGNAPYLLPDFNMLGFNYRMTDLQGAVGLVQLEKLDRFIRDRSEWAAYYRKRLSGLGWLRLPEEPTGGRHAWQAFVAAVNERKAPLPRNQIMSRLQEQGIATRPGTHAVHLLGYYRDRFGLKPGDCPHAAAADRTSLALPLHNRMSCDDYDYVVDALRAL